MPTYNFSSEAPNTRLLREAWVQGLRSGAVVYRRLAATEDNFKQKQFFSEMAKENDDIADKFTEYKST